MGVGSKLQAGAAAHVSTSGEGGGALPTGAPGSTGTSGINEGRGGGFGAAGSGASAVADSPGTAGIVGGCSGSTGSAGCATVGAAAAGSAVGGSCVMPSTWICTWNRSLSGCVRMLPDSSCTRLMSTACASALSGAGTVNTVLSITCWADGPDTACARRRRVGTGCTRLVELLLLLLLLAPCKVPLLPATPAFPTSAMARPSHAMLFTRTSLGATPSALA